MRKSVLFRLALLSCTVFTTDFVSAAESQTRPPFALASHTAVPGVAEIISATPNGLYLLYTNAVQGTINVVDISAPATPRLIGTMNVQIDGIGEPTSLAVSPDGRFVVAAVRMGDNKETPTPGLLRIYSIDDKAALSFIEDKKVGIGPDSVALSGTGKQLRAIVALEDEESDAEGEATVPGARPGSIDIVALGDLYGAPAMDLQRIDLIDALKKTDNIAFPEDPQPEFVAISDENHKAVVSLQENNAIAVLDITPDRPVTLERVFSTGTVERQSDADLTKDKEIRLKESFKGRREADAVAFVSPTIIATANEGDTKKTSDGVYPGGRSFSLFSLNGSLVYEGGAQSERRAVIYGHYPDSRSASKGIEIEGVVTGTFNNTPYLFVGSERGSFAEVYHISLPASPRFVQFLPTGLSPEGLTVVSGRKDGKELFVTANEKEGSITLYEHFPKGAPIAYNEPLLHSRSVDLPWGGLSGLTGDKQFMYAVPDNVFGQSRIFRINPEKLAQGEMEIDRVIMLTSQDGSPLSIDPEGIARTENGFWIAAEGKTPDRNELILTSESGVVQRRISLPKEILNLFADKEMGTGFEGVTLSPDGKTLYVALQRGFDTEQANAAILSYSLAANTWSYAPYPLEQHPHDPKKIWTGISDIAFAPDGSLLILERDKGGESNGAMTAAIKRIYKTSPDAVAKGEALTKTLVHDLHKEQNYLAEKAEGMTVWNGHLWVVNDNDGAGWTRIINAGPI